MLYSRGRTRYYSTCTARNRFGRKFHLFCRSVSTCRRQTLPALPNVVTSRCIVTLFDTSLSRYAVRNDSRTAANDSMWRSNVREWTRVLLVNTTCSHLQSFCAAGVNSGLAEDRRDLESRVTVETGRVYWVYYTGVDLLLIKFLHRRIWVLLGRVSYTLMCAIYFHRRRT
jgi:hypothetical protein